ncbi:MAG: hypothetical protein K0S47_2595 [Herbinix sp.]|nr:hypothetical protein [Herbinix sp.]
MGSNPDPWDVEVIAVIRIELYQRNILSFDAAFSISTNIGENRIELIITDLYIDGYSRLGKDFFLDKMQ